MTERVNAGISICSKFFQFTFGTNYGTTTLASLYISYSMSSLLQWHRQLFKMSVNRVCLGSLCFWSVNNTGVYFPLTVQPWIRAGDVSPPGGWFQLRKQRSDWPAGDCSGHSDRDCDQSGAAEEKAVRHHQSRHCGGELTVTHDAPSFTLSVFNATLRRITHRLDRLSHLLWRIMLLLRARKDKQVQRKV